MQKPRAMQEQRATQKPLARGFAALAAAVSLSALVLQYALLLRLEWNGVGPALATLRFVSYFTILCNALVVLAAGRAALTGDAPGAAFFARPRTLGGIALYIGVTGLVYTMVLRHLWQPQGAQWWADTGLHYATPVLYLAWWLSGLRHGGLRWTDPPRWLLFPVLYLAWCLLRGAWLHEYPYPFIDADALGIATMLRNALGMLALFVVLGAVLVAIDHGMAKARAGRPQ
jgi:hypothetical protein